MMSSRALFWPGVLVAAGLLSMPGAARLSGQTGQAPADQGRQQQPPAAPTTPPAPVTPLPSQDGVAQPAPPAQRPSFRAGVELVSINVTVTDPGGRYLTELNQPDFQVFEDGAQQQVTFFNRTNLPIALSILLDTSASMESRLETAQEAAIGFVRRLRPLQLLQGDVDRVVQ
jgi:Ca-activated chloride channel family protein